MPTRLKKPSLFKQAAITVTLAGFLVYMGANALSGQFGLRGQADMRADIRELSATSATLQAEIDALQLRMKLLAPEQLDPDILTERARSLLSMVRADDIILVMPKE